MVGFPERQAQSAAEQKKQVSELLTEPRTWLLKVGWTRARAAATA
jgi:hypothetical protein